MEIEAQALDENLELLSSFPKDQFYDGSRTKIYLSSSQDLLESSILNEARMDFQGESDIITQGILSEEQGRELFER